MVTMKKRLVLAAGALIALVGTPAIAANISLSPDTITMRVPRGESAAATIAGRIANPEGTPVMATLRLMQIGGSMPFGWLTAPDVKFENRPMPLLLPLVVSVPDAAAPGTYSAHLQTKIVSSSGNLTPATPPVRLSVTVPSSCTALPTVVISSTLPTELAPPNGRLADVAVVGRVEAPAGCTVAKTSYTLRDEYGIFDAAGQITTAEDGSFSFSVPVQASRRGDDKDGRTYQVTVSAEDEVGKASSTPALIVVRHDQRKEK
jgi:hypothetical protein